jgi:anti-sigma factor (TIGR02949 family)
VSDTEIEAACEAILQRLDDYIDRELSSHDLEQVERHLEECLHCAERYRFESSLIHGIQRRLRRIRLPDKLAARIGRRLEAESARLARP